MDLVYGVNKIKFSFGKVSQYSDCSTEKSFSHNVCLHSPSKQDNTAQTTVCFKYPTGNRRQSLLVINYTGQL